MKASTASVLLAFALQAPLGFADIAPGDINPDLTAVQLPRGGTANRPTGADGLLRYNEERGVMEGLIKGKWSTLAIVKAEDETPAAPEAAPAPQPAPEAAAPAPAPEADATAEASAAPEGSHEFSIPNVFADLSQLKAEVTKIQKAALTEVNMVKAKIALIEKQFSSFAARLAKIEAALQK